MRGGTVHVTDQNNGRVQTFDSDGEYIDEWPSGFGPEAIALDSAGNAFVVDRFPNSRIVKFDIDGIFVTDWGGAGSDPGQLNDPWRIAVDEDGNVFVADTGNNRIQKFDNDGDHLATWGSEGSDDGQFKTPFAVALDAVGNVFVADTGNDRIQKFAPNAQDPDQYDFVTAWGTQGNGNGALNDPLDVAVDGEGNVFVADFRNYRIQKFAPVSEAPRLGAEAKGKPGEHRRRRVKQRRARR